MTPNKTAQMADSAAKTVGEFVAEDYRTAAVFEKYDIDFCCGGQSSLAAICKEKNLDSDSIIKEIEAAKHSPIEREQNYDAWDLSFLADYIVNTHHTWLDENTDQIAAYARKSAEVHGAKHPEVIEIAAIFDKIAVDLTPHLQEEEEVFFPAIKRLEGEKNPRSEAAEKEREIIQASLDKLHRDHETIGDAVHRIRHLSNDYSIPADACNTFMVTYRKLKEFEDDLHKHVHLENNILYLKAAQL